MQKTQHCVEHCGLTARKVVGLTPGWVEGGGQFVLPVSERVLPSSSGFLRQSQD